MLISWSDRPCERYGPSVAVISQALGALATYGLQPPSAAHDIWTILLRQAPQEPLRVYALGAAHSIDSLCTLASQYTLTVPLSDITEADALAMGTIYLRRVFFLHLGRQDALRRTIRTPPPLHDDDDTCSVASRIVVRQRWLAAVGEILTGPQPQNTESGLLIARFAPLAALPCQKCKDSTQDRIARMVQEWAKVKRTI